jgi:crotonobetaine/carnitine-CoA ligase
MTPDGPEGFLETFVAIAGREPDRPFVWCDGRWITFGQLDGRSIRLARALREQGVGPGVRVATMLANGAVGVVTGFALARLGAIWLPLNPSLGLNSLTEVLRHAAPIVAICETGLTGSLTVAWPADLDPRIHGVGRDAVDDLIERLARDQDDADDQGDIATALPGPSDPFLLIYTSGTTGAPKGAMVTHRMMRLAGEGAVQCAAVEDGDRLYLWEPLYHIGGVQMLVAPMLRRASLWMTAGFDPGRFWSDVARAGATHVHYLGGILSILARQPPGEQDRAHGVRIAWGAGASHALAGVFRERFGVILHEAYGMTEAASFSAFNPTAFDGSVGRAAPWTRIAILDDAGRTLPPGQSGEIVLQGRGEDFFAGYFQDPAATARVFRPDGLHTGDRGHLSADGRLYYEGRLTDVFRVRGENISAWEVERLTRGHPDVEDCALTALAGEFGDQDLVLNIQVPPRAHIEPWDLADWLDGLLGPAQRPRYLRFVESFERTPSQRVIKHRLPTTADGCWDRYARLDTVERQGSVEDIVRRAWRRILRDDGSRGLGFAQAGGDSLAFLKLLFLIEEATRLAAPLELCHQTMTLAELTSLVLRVARGETPVSTRNDQAFVVLAPGAGGDSPLLAGLRLACGQTATFVTLAYPDWRRIVLREVEAETLMQDLADQVIRVSRTQPLRFAGFSMGSAVAFALALRVAGSGAGVTDVVLIDGSIAAARLDGAPLWRFWSDGGRRRLGRALALFRPGARRGVGGDSAWRIVANNLTDLAAGRLFAHRKSAFVRALASAAWRGWPDSLRYYLSRRLTAHFHAQLAARMIQAADRSNPPGFAVDLFRTDDHSPGAPEDLGWSVVGEALSVTMLPGGHFDSLAGDNLTRIVARLAAPRKMEAGDLITAQPA